MTTNGKYPSREQRREWITRGFPLASTSDVERMIGEQMERVRVREEKINDLSPFERMTIAAVRLKKSVNDHNPQCGPGGDPSYEAILDELLESWNCKPMVNDVQRRVLLEAFEDEDL